MKLKLKILLCWLLLIALTRLSLLFPHRSVDDAGLLTFYVQLLLCLISLVIAKHSQKTQRFVFINFAIFFGYAIPLLLSAFVGESLFAGNAIGSFYSYLFVNGFGAGLVLLFVVVYTIVDYLISQNKIMKRYAVSLLLALVLAGSLFLPFILNPSQLSQEPEYTSLQNLSTTLYATAAQLHREPTDEELAGTISPSQTTSVTTASGPSYEHALRTVRELRPYLQEGGATTVFWRPIFRSSVIVNGIVLLSLGFFFFLHYRYGKPCGAYIDKILLLFFIFSSLEIIHSIGDIYSYSFERFFDVFSIGHYFTILCLLGMVYAYDQKLNFALSPAGRYYEEMLVREPMKTTRWIDRVDTLILRTFFRNTGHTKHMAHITKVNNSD